MRLNKIITLIVLLILTSCTIQQSPELELDITDNDSPTMGGHVELLSQDINSEEGFLEFELSILANHEDARQRMLVFVDSILVPFSVNSEHINEYFDIIADGEAKTYKFKVDASKVKSNKEAKLSISRISIPLKEEPEQSYYPGMYYFAGAVFDFTFDNSHGMSNENKFVKIESQALDNIDPALNKQVNELYADVEELPGDFYAITSNYEISDQQPLTVTSSPNLIFYNFRNESNDFVVYLFKNGELVDVDDYKGLSFTLNQEEAIDFPLEDYNLDDSIVSVLYFMNGRLQQSLEPSIIKLK